MQQALKNFFWLLLPIYPDKLLYRQRELYLMKRGYLSFCKYNIITLAPRFLVSLSNLRKYCAAFMQMDFLSSRKISANICSISPSVSNYSIEFSNGNAGRLSAMLKSISRPCIPVDGSRQSFCLSKWNLGQYHRLS